MTNEPTKFKRRIYKYTQTSSNLNSRLGEVDFDGDFFSREDVWISGLLEQRFENVELRATERSSFAPLLPRTP